MREVNTRLGPDEPGEACATLVLTFDERCKSRQRVRLESGDEVALLLPRGTVLRGGDRLRADDGTVIEVRAAPETLSSVDTSDGRLLARAAYHLGNRHVPLEVGSGHVRYQHDHVLDDMVTALGHVVRVVEAPFEPEGGAYGGGGHNHDAAAGHSHAHHEHAGGHTHHHPHEHGDGRRR